MPSDHLARPAGNQEEISVLRLAEWIRELTGSTSGIVHVPRPTDDPSVRRLHTAKAHEELGWTARFTTERGLTATIDWFRTRSAAPWRTCSSPVQRKCRTPM
ncbi:hypothetical protein QMZ92_17560 [Streptomyces sp. HNM0645]|uniref:hypothetical protein n=1 Tax=Streptomyces sp. HNM0645 TaxID=2782343 RepID=UPI0024B794B5|nr:hypothetical protein [Streptomyces sp. HNM0645]MDI9886139.1 hypothetical protein [Streptomyces sp. HNM0645]